MELLRPDSIEQATAALGNGSVGLAGGTEVVPLLRDRLLEADRLVRLDRVVPRGIDGGRIGAGTTLAELEVDPQVPDALREACRLAASPQLRAMGTIGGNLLQATRCWYWRLHFPCWLHGGERCHAREGEHREHAIFGNGRCASAHPSDPAAALLALGATLRTDRRELPVAELYRLPTHDDRSTTTLEAGELILELDVPQPDASTYLKAMDRKVWAFAVVGVAAAVRMVDGRIEDARLMLSGVAPVPWPARAAERELLGQVPSDALFMRAAELAVAAATPLARNGYKVPLTRVLVRRALARVAGDAAEQSG